MSIAVSVTVPECQECIVGDTIKNGKLAESNGKSSKAYIRGEDSTDDQAYSSTDEGSFNSDGDSSHSSSKKTSASPSRRGSNATDTTDVAGNITELLPSVGSAGHFKGECSRCCFFPKGRCNNGKNCGFCHFDHDRRPRRSKRGGSKNKAEDESTTASSEGSEKVVAEPVVEEPTAPVAPAPVTIKPAAPAPVTIKPPGLSTPVNSCKPPMTLPLPVPAFQPMGVMQSARSYYVPTPMGYNSARFPPVPPNLQPQEGADAMQIKQFSGGRPVKVSLPYSACTNKQLKPTIPAKKRPPYAEFITASRPTLDPQQPVKKRVPVFEESFLSDLLRQPLAHMDFTSAVPAVVEAAKPTVLVPR